MINRETQTQLKKKKKVKLQQKQKHTQNIIRKNFIFFFSTNFYQITFFLKDEKKKQLKMYIIKLLIDKKIYVRIHICETKKKK